MKQSKIFYGWWIVISSVIILATLAPPPVLLANIFQTPITAEFNISNSQFAFSNFLLMGIGIFVSPIISERFTSGNFKRTYLIFLLIYTISYMSYAFAPNIYVYYGLSLLVGLGHISTTILPVSILINNWFIHKRGLALSLALTGLSFGGSIASQAVNLLINQFGWRYTYLIFGAFMLLLVAPIMIFLVKIKPEELGLQPLGLENAIEEPDTDEERVNTVELSVAESKNKPFFILLIVGSVLVGIVNNGGMGQFPPVLTNMHGLATATTIISIYAGVGVIGKLVLGNLNDRFGIVASIIYTSTLIVLTYVCILLAKNVTFAYLMAIFFGMGNAIGSVLPPLITSAIFSPMEYSKAYGYVQSAVQLGMTFGSLLAAGAADLTGSYNYSWIIMIILTVALAISWVSAVQNAKRQLNNVGQLNS